jgi:hypothetical protein
MDIREHMEFVGSDGQHVGTVDGVEDDRIKLTKSDSGDRQHHFLEKRLVSGVEGNKVKLSVKVAEAMSKAA